MNLQDMVLFSVVGREGSFTKAAAVLGVTKQSVSARVANLEKELGVRLLDRTTRRLRLTDAGSHYLARCTAISAQVEAANAEVQGMQSEAVGVLRVSASWLFARRFLPDVVREIALEHPNLRIEMVLNDQNVNLLDEGFDVAIRIGALSDSSLIARKLGHALVDVVASPDYLVRHGRPTVETLAAHRCIGMFKSETWDVGPHRIPVEPSVAINDLEVIEVLARAGVGLARIPAILYADAVAAGELQLVFPELASYEKNMYAILPSRNYMPRKVELFVEAVAKHTKLLLAQAKRLRNTQDDPGGAKKSVGQ